MRALTSPKSFSVLRSLLLVWVAAGTLAAQQAPAKPSDSSGANAAAAASNSIPGAKNAGQMNPPAGGPGDSKSARSNANFVASVAPSMPPPGPVGRPRIGLALGGALGLSEIGALTWFEEHRIPVDMIAGTSIGCMVGALYGSGKTIEQLHGVMDETAFDSVFSFNTNYKSRSFRRREDTRNLPNGITVGLKHGVSFRNAVLTDQGLNALLDRQFIRYDDQTDFNTLPIPVRCIATDLNDARAVTFARGSLPDAVRASVSLPGIFQPFRAGDHEFVDGGILDNLPTSTLKEMKADVILAVSLPLLPPEKGELNSLLGVFQRSFSVAIEGAEREARKNADVVIIPNLDGFTAIDYLKTTDLAQRGYDAAEKQKEALLRYALPEDQWQQYQDGRRSRMRGSPGRIVAVRVTASTASTKAAVERMFAPLLNKPANTKAIEATLDDIRASGRNDADYTIVYDHTTQFSSNDNPLTLVVDVADKKIGPPFADIGLNVQAQTGSAARATLESIVLYQGLGGFGSELRGNIKVGFLTDLSAEYLRRVRPSGLAGGYFVAPHGGLLRQPFYIFENQKRIAERQLQYAGGGVDVGWSDRRYQELRVGWSAAQVRWQTETGSTSDQQPDIIGATQRAHIRYAYDTQDRALIPQYGLRSISEVGLLYDSVQSPTTPQIYSQLTFAHQIHEKNVLVLNAEGGTMFHRNVSQPFRYTLGGPLRLSASAFDEYRGTDYFLLEPALLRRVAKLPSPLGQSIYVGAAYEAGQMYAPGLRTVTRQDVLLGIVAETPLGVITFAPSVGDSGHRKFVFTLGRLF